jgi:hypothetical protein
LLCHLLGLLLSLEYGAALLGSDLLGLALYLQLFSLVRAYLAHVHSLEDHERGHWLLAGADPLGPQP